MADRRDKPPLLGHARHAAALYAPERAQGAHVARGRPVRTERPTSENGGHTGQSNAAEEEWLFLGGTTETLLKTIGGDNERERPSLTVEVMSVRRAQSSQIRSGPAARRYLFHN